MPYANNKGADQPAHPHILISAFVVRCLNSEALPGVLGNRGIFSEEQRSENEGNRGTKQMAILGNSEYRKTGF